MDDNWKNLSLEIIEGELWSDIKNYKGLYQISSLGRVKSLKRNRRGNSWIKERILIQYLNKKGYCKLKLNSNSKSMPFSVHRLVALHFIPNTENKC